MELRIHLPACAQRMGREPSGRHCQRLLLRLVLAACAAAAATTTRADPGNRTGLQVVHVHRRYPHLARPDVAVAHPHTRLYHPESCDGGERFTPINPALSLCTLAAVPPPLCGLVPGSISTHATRGAMTAPRQGLALGVSMQPDELAA
jgi:hypothetical protein